jgi:hypothetical protein
MGPMDDPDPSPARTYPPGFEPPTDVDVPWYAWVLWPLALVVAMILVAVLFRGCMGSLA